MKQTIRHILPLLFLLPLFCACQEELPFAPEADGHYLSLSLATQANTRATEAGEDSFNENKIERADVYFFNTTDVTSPCIYAQLGLRPTLVSGSQTDYTLQVPLDKTIISEGRNYYVYIVANHAFDGLTEETALSETLGSLQEKTITTEWKSGYQADGTAETNEDYVIESSLVMDGGKDIPISVQQPETPETIEMTRAMAKVTLSASMEKTIESNGLTYTPIPSRMFTTLVYAVQCTNLAGDYTVNATRDYITRMRRNYNETPVNGEQRERYSQVAPFYSYPNPENTTDRRDSYLILCVPWMARADGGPSYQAMNYYYRVPITGSEALALLERNHYYKINVHIGVLGSLNPNEAVELKAKFEIMDWFQAGIDADINQYQYLVLDEYSSVMNNVDEIRMPYISSSRLVFPDNELGIPDSETTRVVSMTYWDYSPKPNDNRDEADHIFYGEASEYSQYYQSQGYINEGTLPEDVSLTANGDELVLSHPLTDNDYMAITFTVVAYNRQGVESDRWTITQYPGMYINGYFNEGGATNRFINGYSGTDGTAYDNDGRNGYNSSLSSISDWSGNNSNRHLYTIYISSFDVGEEYAIGDPRSDDHYNFYERLDATEYRDTRWDAQNVIAPAYMVASSWGKAGNISHATARKRCASYQEGGYPAGRWRLPTKAEVEYIVKLSTEGKIPRLFGQAGSSTDYWVSSGVYNTSTGYRERPLQNDGNMNNNAYIRCVYDVWYWGDQTIEEEDNTHNPTNPRLTNTDFVWGDREDGVLERGTKH